MSIRYGVSGILSMPSSSRVLLNGSGHISHVAHLGDVIYYDTTLTIYDGVVGSQYLIVDKNTTSTVITGGTISSDKETISITATRLPMLLVIKLRKASTAPKYLAYQSIAKVTRNPSEVFVAQVEDTIAQ